LKKFEAHYKPIASSSKAFSFHVSEKVIIDNLRQWAHDYFRTTEIFDATTYMMEKESLATDGTTYYKDFDFLGKLVDVEWIDDQFCNLILKDLAGRVY
jgi:hypothetical protein